MNSSGARLLGFNMMKLQWQRILSGWRIAVSWI